MRYLFVVSGTLSPGKKGDQDYYLQGSTDGRQPPRRGCISETHGSPHTQQRDTTEPVVSGTQTCNRIRKSSPRNNNLTRRDNKKIFYIKSFTLQYKSKVV